MTLQTDKIEILMAVYNGQRYIQEQIESILSQTYQNTRLIIRDNCSEDKTRVIIEDFMRKHPGRISLIASPANVGVLGNFSALLDQAKANYVMFSDHDDIWLPKKVEITLNKMKVLEEKHGSGKPLIVHTDLAVVDKDLKIIHPSFWEYSRLKPMQQLTLPKLLLQNQVTGCTMMINKTLVDLARPIPGEVVMHDWWLSLCAAAFGSIEAVNEPTILYRQHGKNDTGAKKFSLIRILNGKLKRMIVPSYRLKMQRFGKLKQSQARHLAERFQHLLSPDQKETLNAYFQFKPLRFFHNSFLMRKYRFEYVDEFHNFWLAFRGK